jgi:hypothetical protein
MSVLGAALISFFAFMMIATHLNMVQVRRVLGYAMFIDIALHTTIIALFIGTSTLGLMQAELSAILFSIALRVARWAIGYSRLSRTGFKFYWRTTHGRFV